MSYNDVKGSHCPCRKRWYVCLNCSPSTAIAHKNRMYNNNLIKTPIERNEYRIIKKEFYAVLEKHKLIHLRKKYLTPEQWALIEPELFPRLKVRLTRYKEIRSLDHKAIGCDKRFFIFNIKRQLEPGMELRVYRKGIWDIDHVIPCAKFDLTLSSDRIKCFNYKNLKPMPTKINQQKGANYTFQSQSPFDTCHFV